MYRARSFISVAVLGWLVTLSNVVPEIRGDLVQYWPFDDGATNAASGTAQNAIAGGNVGELIDFEPDNAPKFLDCRLSCWAFFPRAGHFS